MRITRSLDITGARVGETEEAEGADVGKVVLGSLKIIGVHRVTRNRMAAQGY